MPKLNATAPTVPLQFDQGDDETIALTRHAADGTALDITDYTIQLTIKSDASDADTDAVLQKTVTTHTDPANGETAISLAASETEPLAGTYYYDLREQTAAGVWNTLIVGRLFVRVGATTATGSSSSASGTIAVTIADAAAGVDVSVTGGLPDAVTSHLVATDNPHTTTLEQARSEDNQLSGPVDADGNDLTNVGAVGTESAAIGQSPQYKYVSNETTTVTVNSGGGADYQSIQAAVDDCPKRLRHDYIIGVEDGHDESVGGDGHVVVRGHSAEAPSEGTGVGTPGEHVKIEIVGNRGDPSQCKIETLSAIGCVGVETPQIWGISFSNADNPDFDESATVQFSGCTEGFVGDCAFRDTGGAANSAIQAYRGHVHVRGTDFGADTFSTAINGKRTATVQARDNTGAVTGNAFQAVEGGFVQLQNETQPTAGNKLIHTTNGALSNAGGSNAWINKNMDIFMDEQRLLFREDGSDTADFKYVYSTTGPQLAFLDDAGELIRYFKDRTVHKNPIELEQEPVSLRKGSESDNYLIQQANNIIGSGGAGTEVRGFLGVGLSGKKDGQTHLYTDEGDVHTPNGGIFVEGGGPNGTGAVEFGSGSRIYEDTNGELIAEDSAGNTTQLT